MKTIRRFFTGLLALAIALPMTASEPSRDGKDPRSAWDALVGRNPEIVLGDAVTSLEKEILQLLTPQQVKAYVEGTSADEIVLPDGQSLAAFLAAKNASGFDLSWYTIDGGGGTSTGGVYRLTGTAGQAEAGLVTGGPYTLRGGFVVSTPAALIFSDGFESGNFTEWSSVVGNS